MHNLDLIRLGVEESVDDTSRAMPCIAVHHRRPHPPAQDSLGRHQSLTLEYKAGSDRTGTLYPTPIAMVLPLPPCTVSKSITLTLSISTASHLPTSSAVLFKSPWMFNHCISNLPPAVPSSPLVVVEHIITHSLFSLIFWDYGEWDSGCSHVSTRIYRSTYSLPRI